MENEIVERAGMALLAAQSEGDVTCAWGDLTPTRQRQLSDQAQAVIEAVGDSDEAVERAARAILESLWPTTWDELVALGSDAPKSMRGLPEECREAARAALLSILPA